MSNAIDKYSPHEQRNEMLRNGELTQAEWFALENVFPGATPESKVMVLQYCKARRLDPLKRTVHIMPMRYQTEAGEYKTKDVVVPGISELRTTAHRTGLYAGMDKPVFGPIESIHGIWAPTYCEMVVYKFMHNQRIPFYGRADFVEVCQLTKDRKTGKWVPNRMWTKMPRHMLEKVTEANALRRAFPEELGGEIGAEEIQEDSAIVPHETIDVTPPPDDPQQQQADLFREQQEYNRKKWPLVGKQNSEDLQPTGLKEKRAIKEALPPADQEFIKQMESVESDLGKEIAGEIIDENQQKRKRAPKKKQ